VRCKRTYSHQSRDTAHGTGAGEVLESFRDGLQYTLTLRKGLRFSDASRSMRTMSYSRFVLPRRECACHERDQ